MSEYKGKYAVTFEIEIACEMSAFILSEYRRYFKSKNLSGKDMQDPDQALYWELVHLKNELYSAETVEDVKKIEDVFDNARKHLKEIYENAM